MLYIFVFKFYLFIKTKLFLSKTLYYINKYILTIRL